MKRVTAWVGEALREAPRYAQWAPYWLTAFTAALLLDGGSGWGLGAGLFLTAFGGGLAHLIRHALGGNAYRYDFACPCGSFRVSATDQEALGLLRDAHRSTCRKVSR